MAKEVDQHQYFLLCLCPPSLLGFFNNLHVLAFCFSKLHFFLWIFFATAMDKHHSQLPLAKCSRQRYSEWVFRDVPSDITIEVDGGTFSLHKVNLSIVYSYLPLQAGDRFCGVIHIVEVMKHNEKMTSFGEAIRISHFHTVIVKSSENVNFMPMSKFRGYNSTEAPNIDAYDVMQFPLVSRSGRIRKLVAGHRDSDISRIELLSLPGGAESFELAAKFCYGVNFEITAANVAQLCCVSDYLEMTEDYSKNNLGSRAEEYLDIVACKNLEMCVEVLKQCENLLPLADELKIVTRCIDAIASKACVEQIASSFSRLEYSSSGRLHMNRQAKCEGDWWIEDLSVLRIDLYQRVITAMKCRGVRPESIAASLVNYAQKELTKKSSSWNQSSQPKVDVVSGSNGHETVVVETIVSLMPVEKLVVPISFLFGLLRSAVMLDCTVACRLDLERRIGSQLDIATLDDLLIPSFRNAGDTLFDIDTVHRILVNFSQQEDSDEDMEDVSVFESDSPTSPSQTALFKVAKLVDNYLAEIAPDANLKLNKFIAIAESLPTHARTVHDGLYRSIDVYLKAHQALSDPDRRRLSKLIDFQKLSQEAGAHAAQNERLPLQSIVQVLYFEQLRLRNALFCSYPDDDHKPMHQSWRINSGALSAAISPRDNYASLRRENRELKLELARMRMRLSDLEKDHVCMKKNMEKSNSRKFMSNFSKKIGKFNIFGHSSSRESSSPSKRSQVTDSKLTERT